MTTNMNLLIEKANTLVEALPYINKLAGKTVVIKYGGNAMNDDLIMHSIMQDVATLKIVGVNPILVHGGGPEINNMLKRLNIESKMVDGLRVTGKDTMEVVQMVLGGKINKDITASLNALGVRAVGLCGKDANLIYAKKLVTGNGVDYGYAGEVTSINTAILNTLSLGGYIPVVSSIGTDDIGNSYNINADSAASSIATALKAEKLIFLTDTDGVRRDEKNPETLIPVLSVKDIDKMIADGVISGGMIPKVKGCAQCIKDGVPRVHIINGMIKHPILLEIFTDKGIGTMFTD